MKDIIIKCRFVFPPNMRKYMEKHSGSGTNEAIRQQIEALVNAWEQDIAFNYFEAKKLQDKEINK